MRVMIVLLALAFLICSSESHFAEQNPGPAGTEVQPENDAVSKIVQDADSASEKGNLESAAQKYREALTILEKQNDPNATANTLYK
ncbi:hypothetical protein L0152_26410, partial [bacterium]|nr:hypothetical protein [bacterium]